MKTPKPSRPKISDKERSSSIDQLLEVIVWQDMRIEELENQILKLKGETIKPEIKPSYNG